LPSEARATHRRHAARVLNLHLQGCTLRQIEMQTGVSKSKAQRWLKEAA
jgi:transposase